MTYTDPIPAIEQLGYTPREAAFLYLVARNSGYFLARQFNWFLRRKTGALTQAFINKLRSNDHTATVVYDQHRFVFHLKSKTIYRLLGIENSQNRRAKGDHEIRLRLMVLDYMLDRLHTRFLSTETEKVEFFTRERSVRTADLPSVTFTSITRETHATSRYFVERFPIGIEPDTVLFLYFDEGSFTTKAFAGYLSRYRTLLSQLPSFELSYVALNASMFAAVTSQFDRLFPSQSELDHKLLPHGPGHLKRFFQAERLWEENSREFRHEDLLILREGERAYTAPEHDELKQAWTQNEGSFDRTLRELGAVRLPKSTFKTCLLRQSYPVFGSKNTGSWEQKRDSVLASTEGSI